MSRGSSNPPAFVVGFSPAAPNHRCDSRHDHFRRRPPATAAIPADLFPPVTMHPCCIIAGAFIGLVVAWATFHWFFRDSSDYLESWKFRFKPNLFSLFDGELWDDWKATFKLNFYHLLALLAGFATYFLLHTAFCS